MFKIFIYVDEGIEECGSQRARLEVRQANLALLLWPNHIDHLQSSKNDTQKTGK